MLTVLASQLEEQRLYYERLLTRANEGESRQLLNAHEHERKQLKKANATLAEKTKKLEEELTFVRYEEDLWMRLSNQLAARANNQKQWKERVRLLEEQNARVERETALRVGDLEGQVRDLMFYLDTQSKVEHSSHRDDILVRGNCCRRRSGSRETDVDMDCGQGGTIQIETKPQASTTSSSSSSRRKNRAKR
ncbi:hypothetical protein BBJ28_00011607 [Nothophytophthora sp. Chile5]|nr:hypothetical protein BBJ28_00011607 [Nothophytophthora sp. Chile5]